MDEHRDVCPVHDIKCEEIKRVQQENAAKLPIWVFKIFLTVLVIVIGGLNAAFYKNYSDSIRALEVYMDSNNEILKQMSRKNREVVLNQEIVMEHLDIPYREIPDYYSK
jgi:hypothetical protein